jgi:type IV fimbrial biogenesis protein FimT
MVVSRTRGFTLVELMITIAVAAILLAVGLPGFQSAMRSNRLAAANNELMAAVALARSEAMRNRRGSGICPTANGTTCGTHWSQGWLVWADVNGNATLDSGEVVVRRGQPHRSLSLSSTASAIAFNGRGGISANRTFSVAPVSCPSGEMLVRNLAMNVSGQIKTTKGACP